MTDMTIEEARETATRLVENAMATAHPHAAGRALLLETAVYATGQAVRLTGPGNFGPDHPLIVAYREIADRASMRASMHTRDILVSHLPPVAMRSAAMREAAEEMGASFLDPSLVGEKMAAAAAIISRPAISAVLYDKDVPHFAHLMTVAEFREHVECGGISAHDGSANAVRDGRMCDEDMELDMIPSDATHVAWFGK